MSAPAFTKFINATINENISDISELTPLHLDSFISALCKKNHVQYKSKLKKTPKNRWEDLENVNLLLTYLQEVHEMSLINVTPESILEHEEKIVLGFLWNIIYLFQVKRGALEARDEQTMSNVSKEVLAFEGQYADLVVWLKELLNLDEITDFNQSWADGQLLGHLIESMTGQEFDYEREDLLEHVLDFASSELQIPEVLSADELREGADKNLMLMYLSLFRDKFFEQKRAQIVEEANKDEQEEQQDTPVEEVQQESQQEDFFEEAPEDSQQQNEQDISEDEPMNPIFKSNQERYARIDKLDAESRKKRQKLQEEAQEFKKKFIEEREHRINVSQGTNRDEESIFKNSLSDESENKWEKVVNLSEWNIAQEKDVIRLKKLYLSLKNSK